MSRQKRLAALGMHWGREAPADVLHELCSTQAIPDMLHLQLGPGDAVIQLFDVILGCFWVHPEFEMEG